MARAGKVRGQTPKVAKADKKKNPKGRAAQRVKYNRRFVNVGALLANPGIPFLSRCSEFQQRGSTAIYSRI